MQCARNPDSLVRFARKAASGGISLMVTRNWAVRGGSFSNRFRIRATYFPNCCKMPMTPVRLRRTPPSKTAVSSFDTTGMISARMNSAPFVDSDFRTSAGR